MNMYGVCAAPRDCWGDGKTFTYDLCCGCGNEAANRSGLDVCWSGGFTFEDCCNVYGPPHVLSNLPCWRDAQGPKLAVVLQRLGEITWRLPQRPHPPYDVDSVMPYVLWPSAYALAAWLLDMPPAFLRARRALELGCGLGLPSLAAALSGADALATDVDRRAVALAALAARRNLPAEALARFRSQTLDFRDRDELMSLGKFDVVLIAGQLYSKALQQPLLEALRLLCRPGSSVVLVVGGSRQLTPDEWYGFPVAMNFLRATEAEFQFKEFFLCSKRGYTGPYSGYGCFLFSA